MSSPLTQILDTPLGVGGGVSGVGVGGAGFGAGVGGAAGAVLELSSVELWVV